MSCFSDHVFFISYLLFCFYFLSSVYSVTKKGISVNTEIPFSRKCRRPESNRHGRLVPQDFKSCASASSATAAYKMNRDNLLSRNGTNRARTYDPLLVRQMLSQLSYDPSSHLCDLFSLLLFSTNVNTFFSFFTDFLFFRQHISPLLPAFQTITCRFLPNALLS